MNHLNQRWTMADMDDIERLVKQGWLTSDLAQKFSVSVGDMRKLLKRNGFHAPDHWRRVWKL